MSSLNSLQAAARRTARIFGRESWIIRTLRPIYESLMGGMSGAHGIDWTINGVTYRIDPHYRHQLGREYDAPVAAFLRERVKPGMICLDVGANVGVYVLQFAHWVGPAGRVIAFEPNPGALEVLHRHIQMNHLMKCAEVVPVAIGAADGEAILYASKADGMSRLGAPNEAIADRVREVRVPLMTLDDYCHKRGLSPDWLFVDIEGFEINALIGARELIKNRREKLGIVVEMHPDVWASADTTRALAQATLTELGLRAVPLTGQLDPLEQYGIVHLAHA